MFQTLDSNSIISLIILKGNLPNVLKKGTFLFIKYLIVTNGGDYPNRNSLRQEQPRGSIILGGNFPGAVIWGRDNCRKGNCLAVNCLGSNYPKWELSGCNCPRWQLSRGICLGAIVRRAIFRGWGDCPVPHYITPYKKKLLLLNIYFSFYHNISVFFTLEVEGLFFFLMKFHFHKKFQKN